MLCSICLQGPRDALLGPLDVLRKYRYIKEEWNRASNTLDASDLNQRKKREAGFRNRRGRRNFRIGNAWLRWWEGIEENRMHINILTRPKNNIMCMPPAYRYPFKQGSPKFGLFGLRILPVVDCTSHDWLTHVCNIFKLLLPLSHWLANNRVSLGKWGRLEICRNVPVVHVSKIWTFWLRF